MNENDLFRVMQDIGGKYTDEAHRYAAEFATTRRRRETMKSKPKESIRISVLVSGIAVAACLVFAIGFAVLMRRMNSNPIMTTNESAETILTQNESNQPSITIVSDSQTLNSNTTHPRATTAMLSCFHDSVWKMQPPTSRRPVSEMRIMTAMAM